MKRGGPIARRTPLTAKTPLASSSVPMRRTPINPVSERRRKDNAQRQKTVSAMRAAVQGRCARCGRRDLEVHGHERRGGQYRCTTFLRPDALLDPICNAWCEDNPQRAAWTGWKVSSKWPHDPALSPTQAWALDGSIVEFEVTGEDVA